MPGPKKAVTAFVMINAAVGKASNVNMYLHNTYAIKGPSPQPGAYVRAAWVVTGEYDVIAMVEADTFDQLANLVNNIASNAPAQSPGIITGTKTFVATDGMWG